MRTVEKGEWKAVFLKSLATSGVVTTACQKAKVGRTTVYETRKEDAAFAKAWDDALDQAADVMEEEAYRRAVKGVLKPVYQGGKKIGTIREYSDTLLIFRLKAARPEKYRERQEVFGKIEIDWSNLSDEQLEALAGGADPRRVISSGRLLRDDTY